MNRPLKLSLAVALALGSSQAFALGLGPIEVKSKMNEPLSADIVVLEGAADETADLKARLASAEDMKRVGVDSSGLTVPLDFSVMPGPKGRTIIHVTSTEPVRDPYISFLVEVNWGKGKLLREYNVLLDPPVVAPVIAARAVAAPIKEPERATAKPAAPVETKPAPAPSPAPPSATAKPEPAPSAAKPAPTPEAKPKPESKPAAPPPAPAPAPAVASGEYGPVASGETLWEIANRTKPERTGVNQMMVALLSANPNAFYRDNVNALKRGAVMRIPGSDEVRKLSPAEAQAAVAAQNQAWVSGAAAPPVKIADSGKPSTAPAPTPPPAPTNGKPSRLELVPPKAGTPGKTGADKPGAAGGTDTSGVRADLTRVKEQLATKEQEATELRSRVSDLEKLKADNERLISLKNTQIAELQTRLADLNRQIEQQKRELAKAQAAPAPAAPPVAAVQPPAKAEPQKTEPPKPEASKAEPPKPEVVATAIPPKAETPAKPEVTPSVVPPGPEAAKAEPTPSEPKVTPLPESKPAPTPANEPAPAPAGEAWFENPLVLGGVGAALLLGAIALLMSRRRKPEAELAPADMEAPSLGDQFAGGPFGGPGAQGAAVLAAEADDEELELLERLAQDPTDADAHLELLRTYYERQDADKFEPAANAFYAQHPDPETWEQVSAMGRELLPGNLMFGEALHDTTQMPAPVASDFDAAATRHDLDFDFGLHEKPDAPPPAPAAASETAPVRFDFDTPPPPSRVKAPEADSEFELDTEPELPAPEAFEFDTALDQPSVTAVTTDEVVDPGFDFTIETPTPPPPAAEPVSAAPAAPPRAPGRDPDFMGEDAVGTKLDLARAYMDMGDPDGAKSMLQEVLNEGSTAQREEARRLLDDLA